MIKHVNECVGCPPERGCRGSSCPNRDVVYFICDSCGQEVDELCSYDGSELCMDCLWETVPKVEEE